MVQKINLLQQSNKLISDKVNSLWTKIENKSFDDINKIFTCNKLLEYENFTKIFDIYTNKGNFQIVVVTSQ